ncbi:MAG: hypothetical protein KF878_08235 [Planctomycetes bacterium]|nr:hypothetical protein [Planctomycetota bacterium]
MLAFAAAAGAGTALSPAHDQGEWAPVAALLAFVGAAALGGAALLAPGSEEAGGAPGPPPTGERAERPAADDA